MSISSQLLWLFILPIPIACVAWTVTHEEVFREPREYCLKCSKEGSTLLGRKFFYLFTCEYCFSHYVTIFFIALTDFRLLVDNWRGYLIGGFALVWIANVYMSLFARVRIDLKRERTEVSVLEKQQMESPDSRSESLPINPAVASQNYTPQPGSSTNQNEPPRRISQPQTVFSGRTNKRNEKVDVRKNVN